MKYYPIGTVKILDFYEGEFESCFILFHPFLKIKNEGDNETKRTSSDKVDSIPNEFEEMFKGIKLPGNAMIYMSNPNYPKENEIIESGIGVSWKEVIELSNKFTTPEDIQKALKTSIGAYRKVFRRNDLHEHLQEFIKKHKLWSPKEDIINALTKKKIFQIFRFLNLNEIFNDDFKEEKEPINIKEMSLPDFCQTMSSSYIYSSEKEVMISQYMDTFFCLLLTKKKETMVKILENFELEGILCDEEFSLPWEYENEEFERLVKEEKERKDKRKSSSWLSKIFKK